MPRLGISEPTDVQELSIKPILGGQNVLLVAPTGSGKTEAALLPIFSGLKTECGGGIKVLYITPLRALNRDMLWRLKFWSKALDIGVDVRHGDTPQPERRRQSTNPPDILITTPETLQALLLGHKMREHLRGVRWVIVDEIHHIVDDKRGAQLSIALERLREITSRDFQRIGLSATMGRPDVAAAFLGGSAPVLVIESKMPRDCRYFVEMPLPAEEDFDAAQALYTSPESAARIMRIIELVDAHTSTLIFVNSRQNAEMLGHRFNLVTKEIGVHHGSLSREERQRVEDEFKEKTLRAILCTSTLELGIDVGSVDLVVQYFSPRQVSSLVQRVGRSGHRVGATATGTIMTAFPDDTLEAIAAVRRAEANQLEPTRLQHKALDVLAHQVAGIVLERGSVGLYETKSIVKRAHPYCDLDELELEDVVNYLSNLRIIGYEGRTLSKRRKTWTYYFENLSMIPDERRFPVVDVTTDRKIGILGEEFVSQAHVGLHFICRGLVWNIESISEDGNIYVTPVRDPTAAVPGWDGEMLPIPFDLALNVGSIRREISQLLIDHSVPQAVDVLVREFPVERHAMSIAVEELKAQMDFGAPVPSDRLVLIEGYDRYIVIHASFGEAVNRTLGYVFDDRLSELSLIRSWQADGYRILIELAVRVDEIDFSTVAGGLLRMSSHEMERRFRSHVETSFPFSNLLKFNAQRFGVLRRGAFMSEDAMSKLVARLKSTPVYKETIREAEEEKVDLDNTRAVLGRIARGEIGLEVFLAHDRPSPLSFRMLNRLFEIPELMAPESEREGLVERMKKDIESARVELLCLRCGVWSGEYRVGEMVETPTCVSCGSGLLTVRRRLDESIRDVFLRWSRGEQLSRLESEHLADDRRRADLVLSYGRRAVHALLVHGVGPQTASRVLAKMHRRDDEFYQDLLEAKIQYLKTRKYWDDA